MTGEQISYKMKVPDIIIAIDGYSSTGKSTFAKLIASKFSFLYLDSGALYRGITLYALENGLIAEDGLIDTESLAKALQGLDFHFEYSDKGNLTFMGDRCIEQEIRTLKVSESVSPVSALPFVRHYVDDRLHAMAGKGGVVMDGRDIGTSVFPNAQLKIFMTADEKTRAKRRYDEMAAKGEKPDFEEVLNNLKERDYIDSHREMSPLTKAVDAFVLDNSDMNLHEEVIWACGLVQGRFGILE